MATSTAKLAIGAAACLSWGFLMGVLAPPWYVGIIGGVLCGLFLLWIWRDIP